MNCHDYIQEGLRQLEDDNFYLRQDKCLTKEHNRIIGNKITEMVEDREITEKTGEYLHISEPWTLQMYLLPKIHKGKIPPPGRLIISANECPTERISQLVDFFLQPFLPKIKLWIRESGHCMEILQKNSVIAAGISDLSTGCCLFIFQYGSE